MSVLLAGIPPHERPRERLLAHGVEALTDRELLALVLRSGREGLSALDLATELLAEFGGLAALAGARPEELATRPGVGPAKAAGLIAAFRLGRRAQSSVGDPVALRRPQDVALAARARLEGARRERLLVLVCDAANRLRRTIVVSEGSVDCSLVPVREILNAVLRHDGRAFALAHNHPSADPTPTDADRAATAAVKAAAGITGLRFLGHVVVAGDDWAPVS